MRTDRKKAPRTAFPARTTGVAAATRLVGQAVSRDAAVVFAGLAGSRRDKEGGAATDPARVIPVAALGGDVATALRRAREADRAFGAVFGFPLFTEGSFAGPPHPTKANGAKDAEMSSDLLEIFERPLAGALSPSAIFDEAGMGWVSMVDAAAGSMQGHHIVLRSVNPRDRTAADFGSLLGACGRRVFCVSRTANLRRAILTAELHGGGDAVVVADGDFLAVETTPGTEEEAWQSQSGPDRNRLALATAVSGVTSWLSTLSNTYVWRIPATGALPAEVDGLIGGCIGPLRYDAAWGAAYIKGRAKGIGPAGTQALLDVVDDIRDATAIAALAETIAGAATVEATSVDDACRFLAASFNGVPPAPAVDAARAPFFDERLVACGPDGIALLLRGEALSRGGRVLAVGPPGGGKSAYAKALGARISTARGIGGAGIVVLEPADLLARSWGATERQLAAVFARAERERSTIIADELDSLCAVREADAPASGNAYLIRCLTNEFLRQLDAHPSLPLIATANDLAAVDPAARRRFTVLVEVRDELEPDQERLAWNLIFKMEPPDGWSACRAAVADFTSAAERCRLLGRLDAESHAAAIIEARAARSHQATSPVVARRKGPLH